MLVVWAPGDTFDGEDDEPAEAELPWHALTANAVDVFGKPVPIGVLGGKIRVQRSDTPVFITV